MVCKSIQQAGQLLLDLFRVAPARRMRSGLQPDAALTQLSAELLREAGAGALAKKVRVAWNTRLTTTAGLAHYQKSLVALNPRLQEFDAGEVDRTLRHELAHLLAQSRTGRRRLAPHGAEWRQACLDLGLHDEKRCHDLPLPRRAVARRHLYVCVQCHATYPRVRPLRRRVACLKCCRAHNRGRFSERFLFQKVQ